MTSTPVHRLLARGARVLLTVAGCASASALAQLPAPAPAPPMVTVTGSATTTVVNDRLQAWMRAEAESPSAAAAASQVNASMAKALAVAKGYAEVKVATAGYATHQVSDKVKGQRWHVAQSISLDAADFTAAAALISRLQDENGLLLSGMGFSLAEKTRREAEDRVTQQAITLWQARAQQAAHALGFASWKPGHVTVETGEAGRVFPMQRAMAMNASAAPVALEGGTTDVTVSVSGEAVLQ
jgi:predicted secreted protein